MSQEGDTITNTQIPTELSGEKIWADNTLEVEDPSIYRPESIIITLLADGEAIDKVQLPTEDGSWKYEFKNLPKYKVVDGKAVEIVYTVEENELKGYTPAYNGGVVTNTPVVTEFEATKIWKDEGNEAYRPESIELTLTGKAGDEEVYTNTVTVKADDEGNWSYKWENLPKYYKETEISYEVKETPLPEYDTEVEAAEDGKSATITNTRITTGIEVEKIWEDLDDYYKMRPEEITLVLKGEVEKKTEEATEPGEGEEPTPVEPGEGEEPEEPAEAEMKVVYGPIEVTVKADEEGKWHYEWENLPHYINGQIVKYSVEEKEVKDYTVEYGEPTSEEDDQGNVTYTQTITNKLNLVDLKLIKTLDKYADRGENVTVVFEVVVKDEKGNEKFRGQVGVTFEMPNVEAEGNLYKIPYTEGKDTIEVTEIYSAGYEPGEITGPEITTDEKGNVLLTFNASNTIGDVPPKGSGVINKYTKGEYGEGNTEPTPEVEPGE